MSLFDALFSGPSVPAKADREMAVQPDWLRPLAFCLVLALHAAVLLGVAGHKAPLTPLDSVEVTLEPHGDAPEDQEKVEDVAPAEARPAPSPPPPAEQSELTATPPQVVAPEAIPLPVRKPKPIILAKPKQLAEEEEDDRPTAAELRAQRREALEKAERRRKAQDGRRAARRGVANGPPQASGMSRGDYAGLLLAELRRHQSYPASARAAGITGSVGVAFTVGPSGRVISQAITRSSGNAALDGAARAMMSAVHTPPPPGGRFSTSTSIRFHLTD